MEPAAVIFDLDGTLVDSNDAHVRAWCSALEDGGFRLPTDRVALEIGKGGDQLVPAFLGASLDRRLFERLREGSGRAFERIAQSGRFAVMPGARELLTTLREKGFKLAVATSAAPGDQQAVTARSGLELDKLVDVVVNGGDSPTSKPEPDLLSAAGQRLGVHPSRCVVVGDTPYDGEGAMRAGMAFVGVASGFHGPDALRAAGARLVLPDTAALLENLDALIRTSFPLQLEFVEETLQSLMRAALELARRAIEHGEAPIATLVADRNGVVFARAQERILRTRNLTAHAGVLALHEAGGRRVGFHGPEVLVVSSLEPCPMCLAAAIEARADTVVFGMAAGARGGRGRVSPPTQKGAFMPRIIGPVAESACREIVREWLERHADEASPHAAFMRDLLGQPAHHR